MSDAIKPYRDSPMFSMPLPCSAKNPLLAILTGTVVNGDYPELFCLGRHFADAGDERHRQLEICGVYYARTEYWYLRDCAFIRRWFRQKRQARGGNSSLFNVIGAVLFGVAMYVLFLIFPAWGASTMNSVDISIFHTVFNITCTVVMLPFAEKLVWVSGKLVPGSDRQRTNSKAAKQERWRSA